MLHPAAPQRLAILHEHPSDGERAAGGLVSLEERSVAEQKLLPQLAEGVCCSSLQGILLAILDMSVPVLSKDDEVERGTPPRRIAHGKRVAGPRQVQTQLARQLRLEHLVQAPVRTAVNHCCVPRPRVGVSVGKAPLLGVQRDRRGGQREATQLSVGHVAVRADRDRVAAAEPGRQLQAELDAHFGGPLIWLEKARPKGHMHFPGAVEERLQLEIGIPGLPPTFEAPQAHLLPRVPALGHPELVHQLVVKLLHRGVERELDFRCRRC
mmetsp:Transcript_60307/g.143324  ORF Transcript_60307/g.143324 Transcript_60307/m.143324 type:complete len:267 (-) Transcript_60307:1019-1819(-)